MILRSVKVQGMRLFRNPVLVGPFGDGLNLIHGPNEIGKSTLIEAVSLALFERYSVGGEDIEGLRPRRTQLCPDIEVEFEAGDQAYRLHKRLLDDKSCALAEMRDGDWELLAERDDADEFVRALMHGELPGRGPTKWEHRGLAQMLWCVQEPDTERRYQVSSAVADQIQAAIPGQVRIGAKSDELRERVDALYEDHFTAKGRVKKHSPASQLEEEISKLAGEKQSAEEALAEVERAAERLTDISRQLVKLAEEKQRCEESVTQYRAEAEGMEKLRAQVKSLKLEVKRAGEDHTAASKDLERYEEADKLAASKAGDTEDLAKQLEEASSSVKAARILVRETEEELGEAEEARKEANSNWERGRALNQAIESTRQSGELAEKAEALQEFQKQFDEAREELQSTPCPEDKEIQRAKKFTREIAKLEAQMEVAGLQVEVRVRRDQEVRIAGGSDEVVEQAPAGELITYQAGSRVDVELPEIARIAVRSGAKETAELEVSLEDVTGKLGALLAQFGAEDADALGGLRARFEASETKLQQMQTDIERTADPHSDTEDVRNAHAEARVELTKLLNVLQLTEDQLAKAEQSDESALKRDLDESERDADRLRRQFGRRQKEHDKARDGREKLSVKQAGLEAESKEQLATMKAILGSADCADHEALTQKANDRRERVGGLDAQLSEKNAELPPPEADPEKLLITREAALEDIDRDERKLIDRRGNERGIVDRASAEGRYDRLSETTEDLVGKERDLAGVLTRAQAVKLLRQVLTERRQNAVSGQLPGLESAVTRMLRSITDRDRTVHIDAKFKLAGIHDDDASRPYRVTSLSSGTREQIDLAARIALGETYAKRYGRTMMVLDDALLYTDPGRHDRVKEILKRAAECLQVFILTSHPDRYRGLAPTDRQFDLAQLTS